MNRLFGTVIVIFDTTRHKYTQIYCGKAKVVFKAVIPMLAQKTVEKLERLSEGETLDFEDALNFLTLYNSGQEPKDEAARGIEIPCEQLKLVI